MLQVNLGLTWTQSCKCWNAKGSASGRCGLHLATNLQAHPNKIYGLSARVTYVWKVLGLNS